jgi:hypothetical protein
MITLVVLAAFSAQAVTPAHAASPVTLRQCTGAIDFSTRRPSSFAFEGATTQLGKFTAYGEVAFAAGANRGTLVGEGVVAVKTGNGDMLVGKVTWDVAAGGEFRTSQMRVSWRDSIKFSDGTIVEPTWDPEDEEPQPLVVIAIIAILIGMLVPAVQ